MAKQEIHSINERCSTVTCSSTSYETLFGHTNVFAYAVAFWGIQPVLPQLIAESFGGDATSYGVVQTLASVAWLIGSPWLGQLTDHYGHKIALFVAQLATGLGYLSLYTTWRCRLLLYIISCGFHTVLPIAQAIVARSNTESKRAGALGNLFITYGTGMIIGSSLGGWVSEWLGIYVVCLSSGVFSLLVGIWVGLGMEFTKLNEDLRGNKKKFQPLRGVKMLLKRPSVRFVGLLAVMINLGPMLLSSMNPYIFKEHFHLSKPEIGVMMSYKAFCGITFQALWTPFITKRIRSDKTLLRVSLLNLTVAYGFFALFPYFRTYVFPTSIMLALSMTVMKPVATSLVTKSVQSNEIASAVTIYTAADFMCKTVGPLAGGALIELGGITLLGFTACSLTLISFVVTGYLQVRKESGELPQR